jgi:enoyl-[acyl-carrier protein] reductase III
MSLPNPIDLRGKTALVTGGSRGIGRGIALRLAEAGANVAINYLRNRDAAVKVVQEIESKGVKGLALKANVGEHEQIEHLFQELQREFFTLDIMVSNAASGVLKSAMDLTLKHWRWTMDINAGSLLSLTHMAFPMMKDRGGRIIAVSSLGAVRALPDYAVVGASKGALESLVRHLAAELGPKGILVNVVSAGLVETDSLKFFPHREEMLSMTLARSPARRLVVPEDVANVVLFLCSPLATMIQGQTIVVDGGFSIVA